MKKNIRQMIDRLAETQDLSIEEWKCILQGLEQEEREYLFEKAREQAVLYYGKQVYTRGLIEFSNYCKNNCYYCGIRKDNHAVQRYHLTKTEILECCEMGYQLNYRTFVLQGGEDGSYSMNDLVEIISSIRTRYPDCAITLSVGERSRKEYEAFFKAGANRYLLRHETAKLAHYQKLHPQNMSLENRMRCLWDLKEIGYQVGTGIMVGSPGQDITCLLEDLRFMKQLMPDMIGIGPFIPHRDTPFGRETAGTLEQTLQLIAIFRLVFPYALIPATTALGTIHPRGRELGILAGANVVMPNLSPVSVRKKYLLYDNKICTGEEAAECRHCLQRRIESIGYELSSARGDCCKRD